METPFRNSKSASLSAVDIFSGGDSHTGRLIRVIEEV
jgi:hypothetical protein